MKYVNALPLSTQRNVRTLNMKIMAPLTQGYQGDESFDKVPVNLGGLLSLKERTPSAPSAELPSSFIALESRM